MDYGFEVSSAAQERLAYRALAQGRRTRRWSSAALIWLGQRLTNWGQQLHRRYEVLDILSDTAM